MEETIEERRKRITSNAILKIARAQIALHGLSDTPEEYIAKCVVNTEKRNIANSAKRGQP